MNTHNLGDGGPAFPIPYGQVMSESGMGMSLRDFIANHASEKDVEEHKYVYPGSPPMVTLTREQAKYAYADAMLKARNEQLPQNQ